jgi:hypothetical protein
MMVGCTLRLSWIVNERSCFWAWSSSIRTKGTVTRALNPFESRKSLIYALQNWLRDIYKSTQMFDLLESETRELKFCLKWVVELFLKTLRNQRSKVVGIVIDLKLNLILWCMYREMFVDHGQRTLKECLSDFLSSSVFHKSARQQTN